MFYHGQTNQYTVTALSYCKCEIHSFTLICRISWRKFLFPRTLSTLVGLCLKALQVSVCKHGLLLLHWAVAFNRLPKLLITHILQKDNSHYHQLWQILSQAKWLGLNKTGKKAQVRNVYSNIKVNVMWFDFLHETFSLYYLILIGQLWHSTVICY